MFRDTVEGIVDALTHEWHEGIASFGCVFLELIPGEKQSRRGWNHFEQMHDRNGGPCLTKGSYWLQQGKGLGFLPRGNLWVLDVDSGSEVEKVVSLLEDAWIAAPRLRTPSGGAHFYFTYPTDFPRERLKNHLCHPKNADGVELPMDFKLGPRTLLVAPGTVRHEKPYMPETHWMTPPNLDPRFFFPEGKFWMPPERPFAVDDRPLPRRLARARAYLASPKTPVSINGQEGGKALRMVSAHLVAFLQLDPAMAVSLLVYGQNSWNNRCRNKDGTPYPWSRPELWRACSDAVDAVPEAGVKLYHRKLARTQRDKYLPTFLDVLIQARTMEPSRVWVQNLRSRFVEWSGYYVSETAFGLALTAHGLFRVPFTRAKVLAVEGVDLEKLDRLLVHHHPA